MSKRITAGLAAALVLWALPAAAEGLFTQRPVATSLNIAADLAVGNIVADDIPIQKLIGDERHGCFWAHGRVYIVDLRTRRVVDIRHG